METICKNCYSRVAGNYCSNCGQAANTHDINFKYLWHEIQHGIFHVDKGLLYTTRELIFRPGHTIKEYIAGKRVKHFKPFAYVFILSTLYAVLAHYFEVKTLMEAVSTGLHSGIKLVGKDNSGEQMLQMIIGIANWFRDHYAYGALILLPSFSFASYLAFRKSKYNYLKHLILNAFIAGQRTVVFIVFLPITYLLKGFFSVSSIQDIEFWTWVLLMTWTYIQFFDNNMILRNVFLTIKTYFYLLIQAVLIAIIVGFILVQFLK